MADSHAGDDLEPDDRVVLEESPTSPAMPDPVPDNRPDDVEISNDQRSDPEPAAPVLDPGPGPGPVPETRSDASIHWSSFAAELGLQGLAQEIALNCTLESLQQDYLCLNLGSELLELVNPTIEDEIRQAAEIKLGVSLRLELLPQDEPGVETPQQFKLRGQQERKQAAIEAIRQTALVKKLQETFGAELVESSVRKIDSQGNSTITEEK